MFCMLYFITKMDLIDRKRQKRYFRYQIRRVFTVIFFTVTTRNKLIQKFYINVNPV